MRNIHFNDRRGTSNFKTAAYSCPMPFFPTSLSTLVTPRLYRADLGPSLCSTSITKLHIQFSYMQHVIYLPKGKVTTECALGPPKISSCTYQERTARPVRSIWRLVPSLYDSTRRFEASTIFSFLCNMHHSIAIFSLQEQRTCSCLRDAFILGTYST